MAKKVLIADDEPSIVASLQFLMQKSGYEVKVACDGDEALSLVSSFQPDAILLDVMMPGKSGYEVCKYVREHSGRHATKIVMLTAKGRDAEINKGLSLGADLYIIKPFSTQELLAQMKKLLDEDPAPTPK